MRFAPIAHGSNDGEDGPAKGRDAVLHPGRNLSIDFTVQKAVFFQLAQLASEDLLADALYASLQKTKPVGTLIDKKQNDGFPLTTDLTQGEGDRAGLRFNRFFSISALLNSLKISFSQFLVTR